MKRNSAIIQVLLITLSGCFLLWLNFPKDTAPEAERYETMDTLMDFVNHRHEVVRKPQIVFEDYIPDSPDEAFDISVCGESRQYSKSAVLTAAQAKRDVTVLFRLLKSSYGPYHHFGGDPVFLQARDDILAQCSKRKL